MGGHTDKTSETFVEPFVRALGSREHAHRILFPGSEANSNADTIDMCDQVSGTFKVCLFFVPDLEPLLIHHPLCEEVLEVRHGFCGQDGEFVGDYCEHDLSCHSEHTPTVVPKTKARERSMSAERLLIDAGSATECERAWMRVPEDGLVARARQNPSPSRGSTECVRP